MVLYLPSVYYSTWRLLYFFCCSMSLFPLLPAPSLADKGASWPVDLSVVIIIEHCKSVTTFTVICVTVWKSPKTTVLRTTLRRYRPSPRSAQVNLAGLHSIASLLGVFSVYETSLNEGTSKIMKYVQKAILVSMFYWPTCLMGICEGWRLSVVVWSFSHWVFISADS